MYILLASFKLCGNKSAISLESFQSRRLVYFLLIIFLLNSFLLNAFIKHCKNRRINCSLISYCDYVGNSEILAVSYFQSKASRTLHMEVRYLFFVLPSYWTFTFCLEKLNRRSIIPSYLRATYCLNKDGESRKESNLKFWWLTFIYRWEYW